MKGIVTDQFGIMCVGYKMIVRIIYDIRNIIVNEPSEFFGDQLILNFFGCNNASFFNSCVGLD